MMAGRSSGAEPENRGGDRPEDPGVGEETGGGFGVGAGKILLLSLQRIPVM
jgi:hypothetical protein